MDVFLLPTFLLPSTDERVKNVFLVGFCKGFVLMNLSKKEMYIYPGVPNKQGRR